MGPMWRAWVNIGQVDFIVNKFSDPLLVYISQLYSVATEPKNTEKHPATGSKQGQIGDNLLE